MVRLPVDAVTEAPGVISSAPATTARVPLMLLAIFKEKSDSVPRIPTKKGTQGGWTAGGSILVPSEPHRTNEKERVLFGWLGEDTSNKANRQTVRRKVMIKRKPPSPPSLSVLFMRLTFAAKLPSFAFLAAFCDLTKLSQNSPRYDTECPSRDGCDGGSRADRGVMKRFVNFQNLKTEQNSPAPTVGMPGKEMENTKRIK